MTVLHARRPGSRGEVAAGPGTPPALRRRSLGASGWWAILFVGPTALGLVVFYFWPAVRTFVLSFSKVGPFGGSEWVGVDNYVGLFTEPALLGALLNTMAFTLVSLAGIPLALVLAALLNTRGLRGVTVYRMLYFLPVVTMPAAVAMVWRMLYNGDYGILNQFLGAFGITGTSWLTNPDTALIAVALVAIWGGLGTSIVIFLAALQGVPPSVIEAAALDGAGPVRTFVHVTMPLLTPSIFFVSIINVIGSLQVFDIVYMMVGPYNPAAPHTKTIVYLFYQAGFVNNDRGSAAAIAFVLLALILGLTVLQFRLQKKWVHYA